MFSICVTSFREDFSLTYSTFLGILSIEASPPAAALCVANLASFFVRSIWAVMFSFMVVFFRPLLTLPSSNAILRMSPYLIPSNGTIRLSQTWNQLRVFFLFSLRYSTLSSLMLYPFSENLLLTSSLSSDILSWRDSRMRKRIGPQGLRTYRLCRESLLFL